MSAVEFFNSAVVDVPEHLVLRGGSQGRVGLGVRFGLMLRDGRPVLIDTGYGPRATEGKKRSAMLKIYGAILRPRLIPDQLPGAVLGRQGIGHGDVELIVLTHFHPDHIAGLKDFPAARILASGSAWGTIRTMNGPRRLRHGIFRELLPDDFEARLWPLEDCPRIDLPLGLGMGWDIFQDGSCLGVDLPGHGLGHFGLCWPGPRPLLYAVDTQWLPAAILEDRLPGGLARIACHDRRAQRETAARVRRFAEAGGEVVLCHQEVSP